MRGQIIDAIYERMAANPDIFFVTADMGINLIEKFEETYPDRFANVGIAEQNMVGVSAGLANLGYRPFAYTISNFAIHRCFEQIRNEIGIHGYPITLLGTSTGYDNAPLGPTHHIIDEWGALKGIPGIDIYCPSSVIYAGALIDKILSAGRPAYVRIPKGEFKTPDSTDDFVKLPGASSDVLLVSYGTPAQTCLQAQEKDPRLSVLVVNKLRPLDDEAIAAALAPHDQIYVVEDHFPSSGLYGSLCEVIAGHPIKGRLRSLAPRDYTLDVGTSPAFFHQKYGIDLAGLTRAMA
ncbi:MAG TPA: transketolase C-terminal domain-containing protein [Caulobacteraceae bacterium]|jgi:transketolase